MTILRVYLIKSVLPKTTRIYGSSFVHLVHTLFKCNSIGYACHDAIFFNYFIFVLQSEILYALYFFKQQLFISVDFCCFLYVFLHFVADVVVSHSESIISYHVHVFYTHLLFIYYLKQRNLLPNTNMFWLTFFCIISLHVWLFFVHRISCYSQFVKQDVHGIVQIDSFGAVTLKPSGHFRSILLLQHIKEIKRTWNTIVLGHWYICQIVYCFILTTLYNEFSHNILHLLIVQYGNPA